SALSQIGRLFGGGAPWRLPVVNLHRRVLIKVKPRLVISIGSSSELALACHEEEVRHAELMHGMGYSVIPWGWESMPSDALPTDILTLDGKSAAVFGLLSARGVKIHQVKHPFLQRFSEDFLSMLPEEWRVPPPAAAKGYSKRILVA